jgi:hypothetical protein
VVDRRRDPDPDRLVIVSSAQQTETGVKTFSTWAPMSYEALRPRGWAGKHWSPAIGAEHVACRQTAAIFDESSFAKLEVAGPGAADLLERRWTVSILYVSHEFGAVEHHVERLVLVRRTIVFDGRPSDLPGMWHDPGHVHARE